MAQTGYTPILIYSSSTASAAPVAGNLTNSTLGSELAINITDGKLFYKDNANAVQVIGWKVVPTSAGGTGLTSYSQGDLLYYNSGTTLTALAKNTTATRYLSNTGTNNNPAWAQIDLTNGVTGVLPVSNGGSGASTTFTAGSVVFVGASGVYSQNNANFFWDNSNTRLGLLTASPTNVLSFGGNAARTVWMERHTTSNTAGNNLTIQSGGAASGATDKNGGSLILSAGTSTGSGSSVVIFNTAPAGTSGTTDRSPVEAGRITDAGAYILKGGLTTATGVGIAFPASQSASSDVNTLDDYEEGTWTPVLDYVGGTSVSISYTTRTGVYTKVGNIVTIGMNINATVTYTGAPSRYRFTGLPFTVASDGFSSMPVFDNNTATLYGARSDPSAARYESFFISIANGGSVNLYAFSTYKV